ncbi:Uncharacterized protein TCM_021918 [Theobroma cacao]|uniref:Uncharacterized protein n=1 Tax=Theobroma cacao TaxID=3641 RepID=A0A061ES39_THECC|nr:Uncharacterized protein TCM_021918 [Theobroma cacao]
MAFIRKKVEEGRDKMLNCVWQILKCEFCRRSYVAVMLKMKVEHSESMKVLFSLSIAILGLLYCRLLSVHFSTIDLPGLLTFSK